MKKEILEIAHKYMIAYKDIKASPDDLFVSFGNLYNIATDISNQLEKPAMPEIADLEENLYNARRELSEQQKEIEMLKHENAQLNEKDKRELVIIETCSDIADNLSAEKQFIPIVAHVVIKTKEAEDQLEKILDHNEFYIDYTQSLKSYEAEK